MIYQTFIQLITNNHRRGLPYHEESVTCPLQPLPWSNPTDESWCLSLPDCSLHVDPEENPVNMLNNNEHIIKHICNSLSLVTCVKFICNIHTRGLPYHEESVTCPLQHLPWSNPTDESWCLPLGLPCSIFGLHGLVFSFNNFEETTPRNWVWSH